MLLILHRFIVLYLSPSSTFIPQCPWTTMDFEHQDFLTRTSRVGILQHPLHDLWRVSVAWTPTGAVVHAHGTELTHALSPTVSLQDKCSLHITPPSVYSGSPHFYSRAPGTVRVRMHVLSDWVCTSLSAVDAHIPSYTLKHRRFSSENCVFIPFAYVLIVECLNRRSLYLSLLSLQLFSPQGII
jgi:hypothetical protein